MGFKALLGAAALFSVAYPPTRFYGVRIACEATPDAMVQKAEAMIPVGQGFWDYVNGIAAGNFGPRPTSPVFAHVWDLEKSSAALMASYLSAGKASTFGQVCASAQAATPAAVP